MTKTVLLALGEKIFDTFWQSCEVKKFVVHLLEKYAKSTDNDVDNVVVRLVKEKLLINCPEA
jgi:hypothetical protein